MRSVLALTFHGLKNESDSLIPSKNPAWERYTVKVECFKQAISLISPGEAGTVSEIRDRQKEDLLLLTFDDGFISDFDTAFPLLLSMEMRATFFITVGNLGVPGYLNIMHLKQMVKEKMDVGSHGLRHQYLTTMSRAEAIREIRESKDQLEQKLGIAVDAFAPVGGHHRAWMREVAEEAGYQAFATMIPGLTKININNGFLILRRNHIQRHHNATYILRLIQGDRKTLTLNSLRYYLLKIPKRVLGLRNYDLFKGFLLHAFWQRFSADRS